MTHPSYRGTEGRPLRFIATGIGTALLFLAAMLGPVTWSSDPVSAWDVDAPALVASVDVERMMDTVSDLEAFGSREFHLESSRQAADHLLEEFSGIGLEVELQRFTVDDAEVSNVVATLQGTDPGAGTYLIGAHYDSENSGAATLSSAENLTAPGADDDASGVAAVLEIARLLIGSGSPATVRFVLFGAEEYGYDGSGGCKGSEHYASVETELGRTYTGTAVLDMVGYRAGDSNRAVIVVNDDGCPLSRPAVEAVDEFGIDLSLMVLERSSIVYSDHSSFWEQGIPSMLVVEELEGDRYFPVNPYYHTSADTVDKLSHEQLLAVTQALLGGLILSMDDGPDTLLIFGTAIMSLAIVSVALLIHFRRRRDRDGDDR